MICCQAPIAQRACHAICQPISDVDIIGQFHWRIHLDTHFGSPASLLREVSGPQKIAKGKGSSRKQVQSPKRGPGLHPRL